VSLEVNTLFSLLIFSTSVSCISLHFQPVPVWFKGLGDLREGWSMPEVAIYTLVLPADNSKVIPYDDSLFALAGYGRQLLWRHWLCCYPAWMSLQIQPEAKSTITPCSAGSKVVYMMEDESGSIVIEATPDFYVRKVAPIITCWFCTVLCWSGMPSVSCVKRALYNS